MNMYYAMKWLAGSVLLVATSAHADPIKLSALPAAELSKPPPKNKVHHVSGKAEGFVVKRQDGRYVTIGTDKNDPDNQRATSSAACLASEAEIFRFGMDGKTPPGVEWSPQTQSSTALGNQPSVRVFHREEVVVAGGEATLETRDAIVDATTAGAKTIDKRSLPLRKVATAADGVTVYAFRESGQVQFVVVAAEAAVGQPAVMEAHLPGLMAQTAMASQCRHLRVAAAIEKGGGSATSVLLRVMEPEPAGAPAKEDANGIVQRTMRTLAVHLSTSWLSGDPEAVVSVTSGWQGPAEKTRIAGTSFRNHP